MHRTIPLTEVLQTQCLPELKARCAYFDVVTLRVGDEVLCAPFTGRFSTAWYAAVSTTTTAPNAPARCASATAATPSRSGFPGAIQLSETELHPKEELGVRI